jgi:hypothetical protein
MEDKLRITVIATGLESRSNRPPSKVTPLGVVKPGEVISDDEFQKMRDKSQFGNYLPHRNNYEEDLEIPTLIRDTRFAAASGAVNAGLGGRFSASLGKIGSE